MSERSSLAEFGHLTWRLSKTSVQCATDACTWIAEGVVSKISPIIPTEDDLRRGVLSTLDYACQARHAFRKYVRPENVERFLESLHMHVLKECQIYVKFNESDEYKAKQNVMKMVSNKIKQTHLHETATVLDSKSINITVDVLGSVVWYLLQAHGEKDNISEDDRRIKSWNRRVDENRIFSKCRHPHDWEFSEETALQNDEDPLKSRNESTGSYRSGVAYKSGGTRLKRNSHRLAANFEDAAVKTNSRLPTEDVSNTAEEGWSRFFKDQPGESNSSGNAASDRYHREHVRGLNDNFTNGNNTGNNVEDSNSLLIHIPSNVSKIILVKNGQKIKIEI